MCYVTDGNSLGASDRGETLMARIEAAVAAGVDWIQIREKNLSGRELFKLARDAVNAARHKDTRVLVNDRLDVALAAGAGGVHLREESIPVRDVAQWCKSGSARSGFLVGVSCHSVEGARRGGADGASYLFFGPVFETPTKQKFGPPQGIEMLAEVCNSTAVPVIAIGGINTGNASRCIQAGAAGVAAVRLFQDRDLRDLSALTAQIHGAS